MVLKTREDLPEPDTPVNTVIRRLGISSETFLRFVLRRAADGDRTVVGVGHRLVLSHLIELWRESFPDLPRSSPAPSSTCFTLPLSADAYAMQLCKQGLAGLARIVPADFNLSAPIPAPGPQRTAATRPWRPGRPAADPAGSPTAPCAGGSPCS
jgi:hypothetical protein